MGMKDVWRGFFKNKGEAPPAPPKSTGSEFGFTGTKIFAGLPMEEYNSDLAFPQSTTIYDQMRRSDGQIAAVLMAMKLPIRSTEWYVDPEEGADDEKLAGEIADFVSDNLFGGMKYSWDDFVRESLTMLDFGFSAFEKVYKYETWNGRPVIMLDKYAPRTASSIWRFPQDENYNIVEVQQINYMTGQIVNIPLKNCRVFTHNREGDNIVGISALRPAYKHWYIKDALYSIMSVGIEKTLIGTPYAKLPAGVSQSDTDKVLALLAGVRAAEESGFTIPNSIEVAMLEGTKNAVDAMPFIEHHDTMIARSVLAQFINLGTMSSASGGAYALGNTMVDMFVMGLESIANYIQSEVQKDIADLVSWNFGKDAPVPELKHKNIGFRDMSQVAQALYWLGAGHLVSPDVEMENHIRDIFGIPPLPENAIRNADALAPESKYGAVIVPDNAQPKKTEPPGPPGLDPTKKPVPNKNNPPESDPTKMTEPVKFDDGSGSPEPETDEPEPAGTVTWRRDLTPLEKVVALADINDRWDSAEEKIQKVIGAGLKDAGYKLISKIEKVLNSSMTLKQKMDEIEGLAANVSPKFADELKSEIMDLAQFGSEQVHKELNSGVEKIQPSAQSKQVLTAFAFRYLNQMLSKMQSTVVGGAINMLGRNVQQKEIIHDLTMGVDAYSQGPGIKSNATVVVSDAINIGRGDAAGSLNVKGAQWSAILDKRTCPLCRDLDGKKIRSTDPDFDIYRPPLHSNCRCILIYIGPDNTGEVYDWKTPNADLIEKYGPFIT